MECCGPMKKRKRGEEVNEAGEHGGSSTRKKARVEEDALGKFLSLVEAGNISAGAEVQTSTLYMAKALSCVVFKSLKHFKGENFEM